MANSLRCDDVARNLSAVSADEAGRRADIAGHLASCASCSAWAASLSHQDTAWAATRPAVPSDPAFDALWRRVLAAPAPAVTRPAARIPYRTLAAAASVLVGLGLGWKLWSDASGPVSTPSQPAPAIASAEPALAPFIDVEQGKTLIIQIAGDGGVTTDYHIPTGSSETVTVASVFDIFNYMEVQGFDAF